MTHCDICITGEEERSRGRGLELPGRISARESEREGQRQSSPVGESPRSVHVNTKTQSKWSLRRWKKAVAEVGDLMKFVGGFLSLKGLLMSIFMTVGSPPGDAPSSFIEEMAPAYELAEATSREGHQVATAPSAGVVEVTCVAAPTSN